MTKNNVHGCKKITDKSSKAMESDMAAKSK